MYYTSYDEEYIWPYWENNPKARKEHTCCECQGTIPIGVHYLRFAGVSDDGFLVFKVCPDCQKDWETIKEIFREHVWEPPSVRAVYSLLGQAIREALDQAWLNFSDPLLRRWRKIDPTLQKKWLDIPREDGEAGETELAFAQMQLHSQPFL